MSRFRTAARNRPREHVDPGAAAGKAHPPGARPRPRGDEPRCLRIDNDVPAEQNATDNLPDMRGHIVRADGGELGRTRTVEETVRVRLPDTPDLQRLLRQPPGGARPVRAPADDHVVNRSIYNRRGTPGR
jgi:hypothetical protein